jgi:23S rRNA (uracil1939-C5)-methyltransferase
VTSGSDIPTVEVNAERMATGGEAVARLADGRVIFVRGALAGEIVRVEITEEKKRFARGIVVDVVEPSPFRIEPSCSHAVSGDCGGCDWMHVRAQTQLDYKSDIVVEQLQRLGGVESPNVSTAETYRGRRTTVRCSVTNGRGGYRGRRSDQAFVAHECGAAHPLLEQLIVEGRFGNATEVTLRVGAATGERMVLTNGDVRSVSVPDGVQVTSTDNPGDVAIHEEVAGRLWRISAQSFFQTSHEGAEALVSAVGRSLHGNTGAIVDLYSGVGLLGGAAAADRLACAVESNPSSLNDARHNLGSGVHIEASRVEQWSPTEFATVIADPARRGLAKAGTSIIDQTGASHLVLVSCDPASLGRDTALLSEQGWRHDQAEVIDMFPDTSRIEVVSTFRR